MFKKKNSAARDQRTANGETERVLQDAFASVDRSLEAKKLVRQAARKLQERVAEVGATLQLKKA